MSIKVDVNLGLNNMPERLEKGLNAAANQAMMGMYEFIPIREGHLREGQHLAPNGHTIVNNTPYAKAQFYGFAAGKYRVRQYTTPGTSRRWDLRLKGNNGKMRNVTHAMAKGAGF